MKPAIIAEFCQNHNGDFEILSRMIEAAAANGASHGKMQTIYADTVSWRPQFEHGLEVDGVIKSIKRPYQAEVDRLKALEISAADTGRFIAQCRDHGLIPLTTCFARAHVGAIADAGFEAIKVASYDCASFPLLRELKAHFSHVIVSTGATFDDEIEHAAEILSGHDFTFLHCVTIYPTPLDQMHLARMSYLRTLAPRVGFSDHSLVAETGVIAAKAALALGAEMIERHFTILPADQTRDGPVSITPEGLRELSEFADLAPQERTAKMDVEHPDWRQCIGRQRRALTGAELLNRDYYRGRFASPRAGSKDGANMIFNWEETPLSS